MVELMLSFPKYTKTCTPNKRPCDKQLIKFSQTFELDSEFSAIMYLTEMLDMLLICVYTLSKPYAWCLERKTIK